MRRLLVIVGTAMFLALSVTASAAASGPRAAHAGPNGHLFVAVYANSQQEILRFPFVNGVPAQTPDLTFGNLTAPMAVGRDGTFYATVPLACCQGLGQIEVFPPNSTQPTRQITLPNLNQDTTIDTALVEGQGYLYVGYAAFISGVRSKVSQRVPLQGVAVYPPKFNGGGPPAQTFDVPVDLAGPLALAVDRAGSLYVSTTSDADNHNHVYTVSNPLSDPRVISALDFPVSMNAYGLAFSDDERFMYVLALGAQTELAVYPYGASGRAQPSRTIDLASSLTLQPGLGIVGATAYVCAYNNPPAVLGYNQRASGSPPPSYTLLLPSGPAVGLAIGP